MVYPSTQAETPPDSAQRVDNCPFRIDEKCFNALNYLRPWMCTDYCIARLNEWVRTQEPELNDDQVKERVRQLASGE